MATRAGVRVGESCIVSCVCLSVCTPFQVFMYWFVCLCALCLFEVMQQSLKSLEFNEKCCISHLTILLLKTENTADSWPVCVNSKCDL